MYSRNPADETWFVHAPLKNEKRPVVTAPPPSNIPYLNGILDNEERKANDIIFKDTDSDFIKLSKLGGREDLLIHKEKVRAKDPKGYPIVQWWTDMLSDEIVKNNEDKTPYVFEVPAWFAHSSSKSQLVHEVKEKPKYNPSVPLTEGQKKQGISEPLRYGQLRNYLKPAKVKSTKIKQNSAPRKIEREINFDDAKPTTMFNILSNYYQRNQTNSNSRSNIKVNSAGANISNTR